MELDDFGSRVLGVTLSSSTRTRLPSLWIFKGKLAATASVKNVRCPIVTILSGFKTCHSYDVLVTDLCAS